MVTSIKKQHGGAMLKLLMAMAGGGALMGGGAYYANQYVETQNVEIKATQVVAEDIFLIQQAVMAYMDENNLNSYASLAGGNALATLRNNGYLRADLVSPMGTNYTSRVVGEEFQVIVNTLSDRTARSASNITIGGSTSGSNVVSSLPLPSRSEIYLDYVGRYSDPDKEFRNILDAKIDMTGNDISTAEIVTANDVITGELTLEELEVDEGDVSERLEIGEAAVFSDNGSGLDVTAKNVGVTGDLNVNDITGNGSNAIKGLANLEAVNLDSEALTTDTLRATTGTIDDFAADNANITSVKGDTAQFTTASIDSTSAQSLSSDNANIETVDGETINVTDALIDTASTGSFSANTGEITTASGEALNYNSGQIDSTSTNTLTASTGTVGSMAGNAVNYDYAAIDTISGISANIQTLKSSSGNLGGLKSTNMNTRSANVSDKTTANTYNSEDINSDDFSSTSGTVTSTIADEGQVKSASGDSVYATRMVTTTLNTNSIEANSSSLGTASASSLSTNSMTANSAQADSGDFGSVSFNSASGDSVNIGSSKLTSNSGNVSGNVNVGNNSTSPDTFSSKSSINKNYNDINGLQDDLDNCMYTTKWCYPVDPIVDITCLQGSCSQSAQKSNFTAKLSTSISNCRHGCSYTWSLPSGFSSTCSNGSVGAGQEPTLSCTISKNNLGRQENISGTATITVISNYDSDYRSSDSVSINFENTTPNDPWANHTIRISSCTNGCDVDTFSGTAGGSKTVRTEFSPSSGFSLSDYSVSTSINNKTFTGNCSSSVSGRDATISHNGGDYDECSANVRIYAKYVGDTSSSYYGSDRNANSGKTGWKGTAPTTPFSGDWKFNCTTGRWDGVNEYGCVSGRSGNRAVSSMKYTLNYPSSEYSFSYTGGGTTPGCSSYVSKQSDGFSSELSRPAGSSSDCETTVDLTITHQPTGESRSATTRLKVGGSIN
mgnify:CR=1 FL=1